MDDISLVAVVGSLRAASINARVLDALIAVAPEHIGLRRLDISGVPLYNADVEQAGHAAVDKLKSEVMDADGLVILTPEYNMSVPAVTKNIVDWLSRPVLEGPINQQPVGLIAATPGRRGGAGAIDHLSQVLSVIAPGYFPETLSIASFNHRLDDGRPDDDLLGEMTTWLNAFGDFVRAGAVASV
ncbi:MAG TPA: NAD(P)H-dependent oxidoreductase [Acidimicrobiales bacterium]|nr:NAD(P)H-dependent oxidoreductase [Acidimicrobiales bacterium]